jgi:hypothetical protein
VVWIMNFIIHYFPVQIWVWVVIVPIDELHHFSRWFFNHQADGILCRWVWLGKSNWEFRWSRQWDHGQGKLESYAKKHLISTCPDAPNQLTSWDDHAELMMLHEASDDSAWRMTWTWDYEEPIITTSIWLTS